MNSKIYIPHPNFKFEEASGGGHVIGCVNNYEDFKQMILVDDHPFQYEKWHLLNPDKVYSKFKDASIERERHGLRSDISFSFLREDGAEFSIRFLNNTNIDVIGYWIDANANTRREHPPYSRYPRSYYDFLEWLGGSI
jgi:hypothetical protein